MYPSNRRFGAFSSSADPNKLATRVQGVILASSTVIIWAAMKYLHISITTDDVKELATAFGGITSAFMVIYGTIRSIVIWSIDKWHNKTV